MVMASVTKELISEFYFILISVASYGWLTLYLALTLLLKLKNIPLKFIHVNVKLFTYQGELSWL